MTDIKTCFTNFIRRTLTRISPRLNTAVIYRMKFKKHVFISVIFYSYNI